MKMAAKQSFVRYSGVFLMAGALMIMAGLISGLPLNFIVLPAPTNQQMQKVLDEASRVAAKGSLATPQENSQVLHDYLALYGGSRNITNAAYLFALVVFLTLGLSVVQVGLSHIALIASAGDEPKTAQLFEPLKHFGRWLGLYLMIFIRTLFWSCLFVLPGLVASYRYRQAVYLMLEDPELGINSALRLSGELMRGYKARLFILDFSFILWVFLGTITAGLAELFVAPYQELTNVQFYRDLRQEHPVEGLVG